MMYLGDAMRCLPVRPLSHQHGHFADAPWREKVGRLGDGIGGLFIDIWG